jgi:thiosulfate/3-mercaptopyruvate sulfurtransferase
MKRKHIIHILVAMLVILAVPFVAVAKEMAPIVSVDWLEKNLKNPHLVVLDIRKVEEYKAGHIPGAVNAVYETWAIMKGGLRNELPETDDLFDAIGSAGIDAKSSVVVVGKVDTMQDRANIMRVAWTLLYAGLKNVAVLDGGYNKWIADKKTVSLDVVKAKAKSYKGRVNPKLFASKDYVMSRLGKTTLIDARDEELYSGKKKLDFVQKAGRIAGAKELYFGLAYNADGTFKNKAELSALVSGVAGNDKTKEIIFYCDSGRTASPWAFIAPQVLGYKDVKLYDGSIEEWSKDPKAPMEP